eukprot:gene5461-5462_t
MSALDKEHSGAPTTEASADPSPPLGTPGLAATPAGSATSPSTTIPPVSLAPAGTPPQDTPLSRVVSIIVNNDVRGALPYDFMPLYVLKAEVPFAYGHENAAIRNVDYELDAASGFLKEWSHISVEAFGQLPSPMLASGATPPRFTDPDGKVVVALWFDAELYRALRFHPYGVIPIIPSHKPDGRGVCLVHFDASFENLGGLQQGLKFLPPHVIAGPILTVSGPNLHSNGEISLANLTWPVFARAEASQVFGPAFAPLKFDPTVPAMCHAVHWAREALRAYARCPQQLRTAIDQALVPRFVRLKDGKMSKAATLEMVKEFFPESGESPSAEAFFASVKCGPPTEPDGQSPAGVACYRYFLAALAACGIGFAGVPASQWAAAFNSSEFGPGPAVQSYVSSSFAGDTIVIGPNHQVVFANKVFQRALSGPCAWLSFPFSAVFAATLHVADTIPQSPWAVQHMWRTHDTMVAAAPSAEALPFSPGTPRGARMIGPQPRGKASPARPTQPFLGCLPGVLQNLPSGQQHPPTGLFMGTRPHPVSDDQQAFFRHQLDAATREGYAAAQRDHADRASALRDQAEREATAARAEQAALLANPAPSGFASQGTHIDLLRRREQAFQTIQGVEPGFPQPGLSTPLDLIRTYRTNQHPQSSQSQLSTDIPDALQVDYPMIVSICSYVERELRDRPAGSPAPKIEQD